MTNLFLELNEIDSGPKKHTLQCWHCGKFRKRSEVKITTDWETPQYADDIICVYCIEKRRKKNEKKI